MDTRPTSAERLPELYRAVLDAVVELERRGKRREAAHARREASRAYTVWDDRAWRRMLRLHEALERILAGEDHRVGRSWWSRPRPAARSDRAGATGPSEGLPGHAPG